MAVSTGSSALYSDMKGWYTSLNAVITSYGGGVISSLTVPSSGKKIDAVDINNLKSKLDEMKNDTYLGSVPSLYPTYSVVSSGTLISATIGQQYNAVMTSLQQIKCRNQASNASGYCNSGTNNNVDKANTSKSCGTNGYSSQGSGTCSNVTHTAKNTYDTCTSGSDSNGNKSNVAKSNVTKSNTNKSNLSNSNLTKSNGADSNGTKTNGTYDALVPGGGCYLSCSSGKKTNTTKSSGSYSNTLKSNGSNSNQSHSSGNHSSGKKSNGDYSNGKLTSSTCTYTYNSGTNSCGNKNNTSKSNTNNTCGKYGSGTCGSGTCTQGTVIDIRNAHTTKSNG